MFVEPPEVGVAKRDAERGVCLAVELHGADVIIFCGVEPAICLEECADIGAVDGLSECAAQGVFAGEGKAEHGVGGLAVIERKVHVADAVERHDPVLAGGKTLLVAICITVSQCLIMVGRGLVEDTHAAEVSANVVECLNDLNGVALLHGALQSLLVRFDGFGETALFAVTLAQFAVGRHFAISIAFGGILLRRRQERVAVAIGKQHAVDGLALGFGIRVYGRAASASGID